MAFTGVLIQEVLKGRNRIGSRVKRRPATLQKRVLRILLNKAKNTKFGKHYKFNQILLEKDIVKAYQKNVPIYDYDSILDEWWHQTLEGKANVCWPGKVKLFALSSGTSGASSKKLPITKTMLRKIKRASFSQMTSMGDMNLPPSFYDASMLAVGGCTNLIKHEHYREGDLSGIIAGRVPKWFNKFFKPEREILEEKDWNKKLEMMAEAAPNWNIGIVAGIPSWIQILLEKIIDKYQLDSIHDIWPDFRILVHGGVKFEPYKQQFEKLIGKPVNYLETYLASEGFVAFNKKPNEPLRIFLSNGIFYEFVPFNEENFDTEGKIKTNAKTLWINEVEPNQEYAIIMSTSAGAWRYMIGDTIRFIDVNKAEIQITGRTKHFVSICGEHLSVDNMNVAIEFAAKKMNIDILEYTLIAENYENLFAHKWYLGILQKNINQEELLSIIDKKLCEINDDYATERTSALKKIFLTILKPNDFYDFLESENKQGGQIKFPRVIKGEIVERWKNHVKSII